LRQSEEKFSRAFQTSPYAITITRPEDGGFVEVNDAFASIAGYTREEALADSSIGLKLWVNEEGRQRVVNDLRAGRTVADREYQFRTKNGKVITGLFSAQIIKLSSGPCILSSINDITERKQAEEELRVALAKYKTLFDCFPLGINVTDEAGNILETNPTAQKLLSVPQDEQNKRDIDSHEWRIVRADGTPMPSDEYASVRALKQKCIVENVEMGIVKSNKTITWINVTAAPLPLKGHGVVITYNDITERKRAEESLKESEEKFKNVFDNSSVGKSITSLDGSVNVNPAFCRMLGYTKEELSHQKWQNISHPDDYELTQKNLKGLQSGEKKSARFIKRYFKKDGSIVWTDINTVLQRDKEGKPLYYITAVVDITDRKHAENKIDNLNNELLQKNAELEQLIYVASHDLRSPLVNVQGFSKELGILVNELAEITSSAALPDKQRARIADIVSNEFPEARNYILASVVKMDALLKGLLKLSRLGRLSISMQKIDMDKMVSGVLKTMEYQIQQSGARLEKAALPSCLGDPDQVDQVFTNLIDNAVKYKSADRPCVILISGKTVKGISEYCVEDNGIGIAPQHQSKAFEIFHRLNPDASEGEGLGLAIVKKILSRLGGNVRLESEVGKGSRFIVTLPEG
jgi:PAS domain S-box-containing protein